MVPAALLQRLLAVIVLFGAAASFLPPSGRGAWMAALAVVLLAAFADALVLLVRPRLKVERAVPERMAVGKPQEFTLTIRNTGTSAAEIRVHDTLPLTFSSADLPWSGSVPAKGFTKVTCRVNPAARGDVAFGNAYTEERSALGLWVRRRKHAVEGGTRVYPDYEPVVRFALLSMEHRTDEMGIRHRSRAGQSREFHQLRDYREGDPLSRIDWKATSRRLALTSRDYREQRNQTIILMVDCGHRLRTLDGSLTQFDHCLNAMLLTGFIALRQGDQVGIMAAGAEDRWMPPVKGSHAMPVLLEHLCDYHTLPEPADVAEAAERLLARFPRRAMVVFLTNLRSGDGLHLLPSMRLLRRRHLVVLAGLIEKEVTDLLARPVGGFSEALSWSAAQMYAEDRRKVLEQFRAAGILTVDAPAEQLPIALANRYLDLKREGAL